MALCKICSTKLSGECLKLDSNISLNSDKKYCEKIVEILGEEFNNCAESSDKMCEKCTLHLMQIDKLEKDLKLCKNKFMLRIHKNYELSIAGHDDVKSLNTDEELGELDITGKGTRVTAKDDFVDSSLEMLKVEKRKKPRKKSRKQSRFLTKNNKEFNENLAKPSLEKQVSKIQLQTDKLDCDAFNKETSITSDGNSMDFPTQVLRDQNENKPVTSIKIVYTCDFCDFRTENPELMGSHIRSHEKESNDERSYETKPLSLMQTGGKIKDSEFENPGSLSEEFVCGLCMKSFPDMDHLWPHINSHKSKENDEKFIKAVAKLELLSKADNKESQTDKELMVPKLKEPMASKKVCFCNFCENYFESAELLCHHACSHKNTENDKETIENLAKLLTPAQELAVFKCHVCFVYFGDEKSCLIHVADNHFHQLSIKISEIKKNNAKTEGRNKDTVYVDLRKFLKNPHVKDLLNKQKEFHNTKEESTAKKKRIHDQERKKPGLATMHTQQTDEEIADRRKELKKKMAMIRRQITARS